MGTWHYNLLNFLIKYVLHVDILSNFEKDDHGKIHSNKSKCVERVKVRVANKNPI